MPKNSWKFAIFLQYLANQETETLIHEGEIRNCVELNLLPGLCKLKVFYTLAGYVVRLKVFVALACAQEWWKQYNIDKC